MSYFHCLSPCVHFGLLRVKGFLCCILGLTLWAKMVGKYMRISVEVFRRRMSGGLSEAPKPWPSFLWWGIHHLLRAPVFIGHCSLWSTPSETIFLGLNQIPGCSIVNLIWANRTPEGIYFEAQRRKRKHPSAYYTSSDYPTLLRKH